MEEIKLVRLKLIGFNEQERKNLQVILTLAERGLKKQWQVVGNTEATDFFLLAVTASSGANRHEILKNLPEERCMFCTMTQGAQTEYTLWVDDKHLPSLSSLVALFNQVSTHVTPAVEIKAHQPANFAAVAEPTVTQCFDPQQGLLGYLLASEHQQLIISLNTRPDYAPLYIDAKKNVYYSKNNLEQLEPYLMDSEALTIKPSSEIEINTCIASENLKPISLKDLIWYIALQTSAGRVIKGSAKTDIVALKGWPDLKLFKCANYAKLATFMKNNAASLEVIAEQTKMPIAEVNNFYNACYLMGLIEQRNQQEINKKDISPERLDLLAKIDARLK